MPDRDWTMDDVVMLFDGGRLGIYDGWIAAELSDGRIVNRWDEDDYRYARTQEVVEELNRRG
jgi:hypothetical protein